MIAMRRFFMADGLDVSYPGGAATSLELVARPRGGAWGSDIRPPRWRLGL